MYISSSNISQIPKSLYSVAFPCSSVWMSNIHFTLNVSLSEFLISPPNLHC